MPSPRKKSKKGTKEKITHNHTHTKKKRKRSGCRKALFLESTVQGRRREVISQKRAEKINVCIRKPTHTVMFS